MMLVLQLAKTPGMQDQRPLLEPIVPLLLGLTRLVEAEGSWARAAAGRVQAGVASEEWHGQYQEV